MRTCGLQLYDERVHDVTALDWRVSAVECITVRRSGSDLDPIQTPLDSRRLHQQLVSNLQQLFWRQCSRRVSNDHVRRRHWEIRPKTDGMLLCYSFVYFV